LEFSNDKNKFFDENKQKSEKEKKNLIKENHILKNEINNLNKIINDLNREKKFSIENFTKNYFNEDKKINKLLQKKENELSNKFKEFECLIREECLIEINKLKKNINEKISENEKLKYEIDLLNSEYNKNYLNDIEKLKLKIFQLETDNEKLSLTNKLNNDLISDMEKKLLNNNNLIHIINDMEKDMEKDKEKEKEKEKSNELEKCNDQYKNEILIIELKTKIKKLENDLEIKEIIIENSKQKIKELNNDNLTKDFKLNHIYYDTKNKEFNEIIENIKNLEKKNTSLISENDLLKLNLKKFNKKIEFLENENKTNYENIEKDLIIERNEKEDLNLKFKDLSKIYQENQQKLMEEVIYMKNLFNKKESEIIKKQHDYEERIYHVNKFLIFLILF
jgi:hypothetical protein